MRKSFGVAALATVIIALLQFDSFAQLNFFLSSFEAESEAVALTVATISADTIVTSKDSLSNLPQWQVVENFTFGKDRGNLTMIADINALHPYFRDKVRQLIARCKAQGIELAVVETYRTHAKQNEYKMMGKKYTNSSGGKSKHQYGLAVDVVPLVNGVAVWDNLLLWRKVGVTGEKLGLRWGGRWKKPYDPGHFEWTGGLTSMHLAAGQLPVIPGDHYPCIHEDIESLKNYWHEWEKFQHDILTKKIKSNTVSTN
jgi:hypothetical protein